MKTLTASIVGMYFRPPASLIINSIPSGTPLMVKPEPENEYDPNALRVLLDPCSVGQEVWLAMEDGLAGFGLTPQDLMAGGPIHLGYINAKPPKGNPTGWCAATLAPLLRKYPLARATLGFSNDKPTIHLQLGD